MVALLSVLAAAPVAAFDVTVRLRSAVGSVPMYGRVTAFQASDQSIVARTHTTLDGTIHISLPAGTYSFYAFSFSSPSLAVEVGGVTVSGNRDLDLALADPPAPSYLQEAALSQPVVFNDGEDPSLYSIRSTSPLGSSVEAYNAFGTMLVDGERRARFPLFDDGTHGDAVAGDLRYSRTVTVLAPEAGTGGIPCQGHVRHLRLTQPLAGIARIPILTLACVPPAERVEVREIDGQTRVANFAVWQQGNIDAAGWGDEVARRMRDKLVDLYDFLYLFPLRSKTSTSLAPNQTVVVRNDVQGIGQSLFDFTGSSGFGSRLRSLMFFETLSEPPLAHETLHAWGAYLEPLLGKVVSDWGAHWGYSGVDGQLGGFPENSISQRTDGTWDVSAGSPTGYLHRYEPYAPLELYVAGMGPLSQVPTIPVLDNAQPIGGDYSHVTASGLRQVTPDQIVATFGPRVPNFASAPHAFRGAVVAVSPQPPNAATLSFLSREAQVFGGILDETFRLGFPDYTQGVGSLNPSVVPHCGQGGSGLCLGGRFDVRASWEDFTGRRGQGHPVALSGDTGYFWFFDPANVELIVKSIDGRGLNQKFWTFYGALSTVRYQLTVTDTVTGEIRTYVNPAGTLASRGDTASFPVGAPLPDPLPASASAWTDPGADEAEQFQARARALAPPAEATIAAGCSADATHLCLGGRFRVSVSWRDFAGHTGNGTAIPISSDTGYFWFFGAANVELVTKVLDGRPVNGKFWFFYGALSNVEYTITVTDTTTGATKPYPNPANHFGSVADTRAF